MNKSPQDIITFECMVDKRAHKYDEEEIIITINVSSKDSLKETFDNIVEKFSEIRAARLKKGE